MAEVKKIAELDIDTDKLLDSMSKTMKQIDELKKKQEELKQSGKENSEAFNENAKEITKLGKTMQKLEQNLNEVTGGTKKLEDALDDEIDALKESGKETKDLEKAKEKLGDTTDDVTDSVEKNTDETEDNAKAQGKLKNALGNVGTGIKGVGTALKGLGIGLIVAAVAALTSAFMANDKVMNFIEGTLAAVNAVLQPVVNNVIEAVKAAYKATGEFDALGKVLGGTLKLALTSVQLLFLGLKDAVLSIQLAWEDSFLGDGDPESIKTLNKNLEENRKTVEKLKDEWIEAGGQVVDNFKEAASEVGALGGAIADGFEKGINEMGSFKDAFKKGVDNAAFLKALAQLDAKQEAIALKRQAEAETLRALRDDETYSLEERNKFNEELLEVIKKQMEEEKAIVKQRIGGLAQIASMNKNDMEAQAALAEARNGLLDIEERYTGLFSEYSASRNGLRNEELGATAEYIEKKAELEKNAHLRKTQDEAEAARLEIEADIAAQEREIEAMVINEERKTELLLLLHQERDELLAINAKEGLAAKQKEADDWKALELSKLAAKQMATDQIIALVGEETAIGKIALIAKQAMAMREWLIEAGLLKMKQTAAIGEATVNTATGISKSAAAAPFPANIPLIIGFIAQVAGIIGTIKSAVAPKKPQFGNGGLIKGPSHFGGGVDINAEGNEYMLNKRATSMFFPLVDKLNDIGNGKMGASGADSGLINYDLMAAKVAQANMSIPAPRVAVDEIAQTQNRVQTIEKRANF